MLTIYNNYYQILWAMYKKEVLKKAFQIINSAKFHNDNFIELVIGSRACNEGGIKFLKDIWGDREISLTEHWGSRHAPIVSMEIAKSKADYQRFKEWVDLNTFVGFADIVLNNYLNGQNKSTVSFRNSFTKMIPGFIKNGLRKKRFFQNAKPKIVLDPVSNEQLNKITLIFKSIIILINNLNLIINT